MEIRIAEQANTRLVHASSIAVTLLVVLTTSCGSLRTPSQAISAPTPTPSGTPAVAKAVDLRSPERLPQLTAGSSARLLPARGAIVIRDAAHYVFFDSARYTLYANGQTAALDTEVAVVRWTADGQLIGSRQRPSGIDLVRIADDGSAVSLATGLQSAQLVVGGRTVVAPVAGGLAAFEVSPSSADAAPRVIAPPPSGWSAELARVSPDGRRLALLDSGRLVLYDIATRAATTVASGIDSYGSPIGWSWSGDALLFGGHPKNDPRGMTLSRFDVATGATTVIWTGDGGTVSMPTGTAHGIAFQTLPRGTQKEEQSEYRFIPNGSTGATVFQRGGLGLLVSTDGLLFSFSRTVGPASLIGAYVGALP